MQTGKAISIPSILKVGNGTLNKIGEYLKSEELTSVVIFMGNGLIDMFGDTIMTVSYTHLTLPTNREV